MTSGSFSGEAWEKHTICPTPSTSGVWGGVRAWRRRGVGTASVVLVVLLLALAGHEMAGRACAGRSAGRLLHAGSRSPRSRCGSASSSPAPTQRRDWTPSVRPERPPMTPGGSIELDPDWALVGPRSRLPPDLPAGRQWSIRQPAAGFQTSWSSAPANLAKWLTDHPRLKTTSQRTSLAGVPAVRITARTS